MFFQQLINGITLGSTYALTAIGYTMVFGILELINFSHGSVYMTGAFLFYVLVVMFNVNIIAAFLLAILVTGALGYILEKLTLKPLRIKKAAKITALISTIGVSIILQNGVMLLLGSETKGFPTILKGKYLSVLGTDIAYIQLFILAFSLLMMISIHFFIKYTKMGKAMRGTAQNMEAAALMGISIDRVVSFTFFLGAAIAAVSGILVGMYYQTVDPGIGYMAGLKAFSAAVLGGIGVLPGAMLGGLLIGVSEIMAAGYIHAGYRDAVAFSILILVLLFKPSGLLGKPFQRKV
ncbi:branched-chain amino acid ABC transporter permease [Petroclostridium sp. X23]|uniref:branched-chain amino acid ABC transporter permease n=1 Tax=Petroclostridium sp. X23 TaxID=3045146 RepID=UPI0024ADFCBA|nr:branched-chain amino acid ABC transporter permease [Petroclostridium sp. X23]WHH57647.1 branched-chain amino acid ABC transporter permease [Petroclostridium sp. X23]